MLHPIENFKRSILHLPRAQLQLSVSYSHELSVSYPSAICQLPLSYPAVIHELYANALQSLLMFVLRSPWILVITSTHGNNSSYTPVIHELCPLG